MTMNVIVKADNLPELQLGREKVYVMLTVKCGNLWTEETQVLVSLTSGRHVFLQTDKPIYHPGSTGTFLLRHFH